MYQSRGMGALQPLGYSIWDGTPHYYSESGTFSEGMPSNCETGDRADRGARTLPADGETCFMLEFPFIGKKEHGCNSMTVQGGYGAPYVACRPIILQGRGFDIFSPIIRLAATGVIAYLIFGGLRGR